MDETEKPKIPNSDKSNPDAVPKLPTEAESGQKGVTDAANPKLPTEAESEYTQAVPLSEEPQSIQLSSPPKANRWRRLWVYLGKVVATLFGVGSTCLFLLALWDSYRPKITIDPGGTFNSKTPFGTYFIAQNQGSLPISHVTYRTTLTIYGGPTNQAESVNIDQNVTIIPQMRSLESYSMPIQYPSVQLNEGAMPTNQILPTNQIRVQITALTLSFDVSYITKFFGERTDTLYFYGAPDVDGNWQWLPTAHQSIFDQAIDTNLIQRAQTTPAAVTGPTNGAALVHTNQVKSN